MKTLKMFCITVLLVIWFVFTVVMICTIIPAIVALMASNWFEMGEGLKIALLRS